MPKIELQNVSYTYGEGTPVEKKALTDVNLKIEENRITGLIGHTGCGKSTLVQLLNGLLKPTEGKVLLDGHDIWENPKEIRKIRFRVGLVFQYPEYQLFEETVYKDIAFGPTNMGLDKNEVEKRVRTACDFVDIEENLLEKSPFELSGGQKRRIAIAGVLAMNPEVLVLDEPAAGLDPMGREEILGGIRSYQRSNSGTVIIVSHSMEDMARYSDDLVLMKKGEIHMTGPCAEVFSHSETLQEIGLDIPQITDFMCKLKEAGLQVSDNIITIDQAVDEMVRCFKESGVKSCSKT